MDYINLFAKLDDYCDSDLTWEHIDEMYNSGEDADTLLELEFIPMVEKSLADENVLAILQEICATIHQLRSSAEASYDNTHDSWDQVIKQIQRDKYLSFIFAVSGLGALKPLSKMHRKLSIAAASTYFLSLTIPGAKGFHIFDDRIIQQALLVFDLIEKIRIEDISSQLRASDKDETWVNFSSFYEYLELVFRYVHFDKYTEARDLIIQKLIKLQFLNHEKGYENFYAANFHVKSFDILSEVIRPHNGDPKATFLKIMSMTLFLHTYPSAPSSRSNFNLPKNDDSCEHISDWFLKMIPVSPDLLVEVLHIYIKRIITNAAENWKAKDLEYVLDYAAKYDAELFRKCNASIIPFLEESILSQEISIRLRTVQLLARILKTESSVDWTIFCRDVSKVPREILIIRELIKVLRDHSSNVKDKALHGLTEALHSGTLNAVKILKEGILYSAFNGGEEFPGEPPVLKNEIRFRKPDPISPKFTLEGQELLKQSFNELPKTLYTLFKSPSFHTRRNTMTFLEQLVKINPLIIYNTELCKKLLNFTSDSAPSIRKHALEMVDSILTHYPNCYPMVLVWCKFFENFLVDTDDGNVTAAGKSFQSKVLMNIKGIDQTNKAEHFMPWVIIRELISNHNERYILCYVDKALEKISIDQSIVGLIESHLRTSNSTEAWVLLNLISRRVKMKNPDFLIHTAMNLDAWNNEQVFILSTEVLCGSLHNYSRPALNIAFSKILNLLKAGTIHYTLVGTAIALLLSIHHHADSSVKPEDMEWMQDLNKYTYDKLLSKIAVFTTQTPAFMTHLFTYAETYFHFSFFEQNTAVINFVHTCIRKLLAIPRIQLDNECLLNSMIKVAGMLSLFDKQNAEATTKLYKKALLSVERPETVSALLTSIRDLCSRFAFVLDTVLDDVLEKLNSKVKDNQIETFNCIRTLILTDHVKLQGKVTIALIEKLMDDDEDISNPVCEFLHQYKQKNDKNMGFFRNQLTECPFMLNEYKFEGGSHALISAKLKSRLKGDEKRSVRYRLYDQLISDLNDCELLDMFNLLNKVKAILAHQSGGVKAECIHMIKDVFYILKRICEVTTDKRSKQSHVVDEEAAVAAPSKTSKSEKSKQNPETAAMDTVRKTMSLVPFIGKIIAKTDPSFENHVDDLADAICKRFTFDAQAAQPVAFWKKYLSKIQGNRRRKPTNQEEDSGDDSD